MSAARKLLMAAATGDIPLITDTFDGNENPHRYTTSGAAWIQTSGSLSTVDGAGAPATFPLTNAPYPLSTPALEVGSVDQYITAATVEKTLGIAVRMRGGNIVTGSYLLSMSAASNPDGGGGGVYVGTGSDASSLQGVSGNISQCAFTPGDVFTLRVSGSLLTVLKNGEVVYGFGGATPNGCTEAGLYLSLYDSTVGARRVDNLTVGLSR